MRLAVTSMDHGVFKGAKVVRRRRAWKGMAIGMTQPVIVLVSWCPCRKCSRVLFSKMLFVCNNARQLYGELRSRWSGGGVEEESFCSWWLQSR